VPQLGTPGLSQFELQQQMIKAWTMPAMVGAVDLGGFPLLSRVARNPLHKGHPAGLAHALASVAAAQAVATRTASGQPPLVAGLGSMLAAQKPPMPSRSSKPQKQTSKSDASDFEILSWLESCSHDLADESVLADIVHSGSEDDLADFFKTAISD